MLDVAWLSARYVALNHKFSNVWIAYSGGVDSHVLLHLAQQYFPNLRAIHINHNVNDEDQLFARHCKQTCANLNIPLECVNVNVQIAPGLSFETAARQARREAWKNILGENDLLLLAHHAEDQAETILYRLLRGTGPHGLTGMRERSKLDKAYIWRPLLNISKQEILSYAKMYSLKWMQDITNTNNTYDRNYLRNNVMPILLQRWPTAMQNINRAGLLANQLLMSMQPMLMEKLHATTNQDQTLNLSILSTESQAWQIEILRAWLAKHQIVASLKKLTIILNEVIGARKDAVPELLLCRKIIKRSNNKLFILDINEQENKQYELHWDAKSDLQLPCGKCLKPSDISTQESFINKIAALSITVRKGTLGRKAKKIFQQHAIPPWQRSDYPLLFANGRLISIVGLWCSNRI